MRNMIKNAALALAAGGLTIAVPATAADFGGPAQRSAAPLQQEWAHDRGRHNGWSRDRHDRYNRYDSRYDRRYGEPLRRDTRVWRERDGRVYCRKSDGTTGLIVGGAVGALLGREIDGGRDRTLGTILGAAGGALLGKSVDSGSRCR
ncbi:conserved hypothetical protein [Altererythrobacter sp. B11]|uniref:glycine zipper 2TM domain-containing protein n=1 Tax=Altererythrobacter sp. B11 TaxID=2060312 RepID=UPI000DC70F20|nr:glycine zipper 2TM domain-containing protein [Altererythrobacter sp. B11]BBC72292.1 conserved hypothetical protein [Altererythrobacter sp. B11]